MLQQLEHLSLDIQVLLGCYLQECGQSSLGLQNEVVDWVAAVDAVVCQIRGGREGGKGGEGVELKLRCGWSVRGGSIYCINMRTAILHCS